MVLISTAISEQLSKKFFFYIMNKITDYQNAQYQYRYQSI